MWAKPKKIFLSLLNKGLVNFSDSTLDACPDGSEGALYEQEYDSLDAPRDQHIRHAYVETAFAVQGRTADHVLIHADSKATNLVDQKSFYVGISRARSTVAVFTNDRDRLVAAMSERAGQVQTAVARVGSAIPAPAATKGLGAGLG